MNVYIFLIHSDLLPTPLWRRFAISVEDTFADLDAVIRILFGYSGAHSHEFLFDKIKTRITNDADSLGRARYLNSAEGHAYLSQVDTERHDIDLSVTVLPSSDVPLSRLVETLQTFRYLYDFEDQWLFEIEWIDTLNDFAGQVPQVLEGLGSAPFEDCGGLEGYLAMLACLTDPSAPEGKDLRDWMEARGHRFYDKDQVNENLAAWQAERKSSETS